MSTSDTFYLPDGLPRPEISEHSLAAPYWAGLEREELWVQRCASCGTWQWGPEWNCHACLSFDMTWEQVEGEGTIHSWIRAWHPTHPALKEAMPYIVVLVSLPSAGGIRMIGNLLGDRRQTVEIGAPATIEYEHHIGDFEPYTLAQWRTY